MAQHPRSSGGFVTGMQNSIQGAVVVSTPSPKEKLPDIPDNPKFIFYSSCDLLNAHPGGDSVIAFRDHFFRTDDLVAAAYIRKELMGRVDIPFVIEEISAAEFIVRTSLVEQEALPTDLGEGVIIPMPAEDLPIEESKTE
jgi:hypothetical protein